VSAPLNTGGDTTVNLSAIPAATYQALRVELDLVSADGHATPRVNSFKVLYTTQPATIGLTLGAAPLKIVFGKRVTLSGALTQGAGGLAAQSVALAAQAAGAPGFAALPPATTDSVGAFVSTVSPSKNTTYKATYSGASSEPTVSVSVAYLITLKVIRKSGTWSFRGKVAPNKRGRIVVIQVKTRSGWKRFAKVKLSKKSTFSVLRKLSPHKRYRFRATTARDAAHFAGVSRIVSRKT
jgi:hypothetical protein